MNSDKMLEILLRHMSLEEVFNNLHRAMTEDEAKENFEYIALMNDVELKGDDLYE